VSGLYRKLFRDLKTMGMQIFTIALLIMGGLSVLVSSWSSYQSLKSAKEYFYREFHYADLFADVIRAPESVVRQIVNFAGVEKAEPRIIKDGLVEVGNQVEPALGRFVSWNENQQINLIYLRKGRMPQRSSQLEVVVHEAFADAHKLKIGDFLKIQIGGKQKRLLISGVGLSPEYVYALSPVAPLPDDKHFGVFWVHYQDLQAMTGLEGSMNAVQIKTVQGSSINDIKSRLDKLLSPYGNMLSYDRSKQLSNVFVDDEIRQQRVIAMVMPTIFLSVAMYILNIILSRLIALHRAQIATLKALGYSDWELTFHYFQLVTVILIIGIVPSIIAGAWIGNWYASMYKEFFRFPKIDFNLSVAAVSLSILAGLVPGWLGAARALNKVFLMRPAEALRPPSPPQYQKGIFEKIGKSLKLNLFSKMILRSLLFRPLRLILSIIGMSLSLAILINGSFWTDVMDSILDRQFQQMNREDLTIRFIHPREKSVVNEIKKIPGVIMIEGERTMPVRLKFKNITKEISVISRESNAGMSRMLDEKGRPVKTVEGGILLSRYFEDQYKIQKGDVLSLKALQGLQNEFSVPVMGFSDDLIGQSAYAQKHDLHMWLKESEVYDTVKLKIDPKFAESIYVALKSRPEVAGITIRELLLKSFTTTVADMILTFTFILYIFAVAIAGAVMYNSAHIAFSERGWELASLRILGFNVGSTFEILFVDIGMQVLLSLIPGLAFGFGLSYLSTLLIHNDTFKFPFIIDSSTYAAAVLVILSTFFVSGYFLYRQVKALDFSEALKARE
jgi:putative ABC transport system permease protein